MQNNILTILTGATGVGLVEATEVATSTIPSPAEIQDIGSLVIQLVIGIITIWKLIKKPKEPKK